MHVVTNGKIQSNLSLYSLYYAEACNKFAGPVSASFRPATQLHSKKYCSGGEPLAKMYCLFKNFNEVISYVCLTA